MAKFLAIFLTGLVIAAILAGGPCLYVKWMIRREKRKWKKVFGSIQVGDKYIKKLVSQNPFDCGWGSVVTVVDRKCNEDGEPYVKYEYNGGMTYTCSLEWFFKTEHYVPYNNQDKQS